MVSGSVYAVHLSIAHSYTTTEQYKASSSALTGVRRALSSYCLLLESYLQTTLDSFVREANEFDVMTSVSSPVINISTSCTSEQKPELTYRYESSIVYQAETAH